MSQIEVIKQQFIFDQNFRVFGNIDNPLFMARDVADWIGHTDLSRMMDLVDEDEKLKRTLYVSGRKENMEDIIVKDLKTLEFEIDLLKKQTTQNIIEIGKRLIEAKNQVPHGEWEIWLRNRAKISRVTAGRFMRVATEFPNVSMSTDLTVSKAFELLTLSTDERKEFIENNDINEMTTRELREEIQKRKQLEIQNHALQETLAHVQSSRPEVIEKEVIKEVFKEVIPDDYEELKRKYESKSLLEKQIKALEEEIYKKDTKILSLQIAQREAVNKLPETEQKKKLVDDSWTFVWRINSFLKDIGGLVYITQSIKELPTDQKNRYISAIENIVGWANQIKFNLEEEIKNE